MMTVAGVNQLRLSRWLLGVWLLLGAVGLLWPTAPPLLLGLANDLLALAAVLSVGLLLGVPLGALAGSGPRWVDVTLSFTTDWITAVPAVLLLAFVRPAGVSYTGGLILLGALRSLEVGWVIRSALLRAARVDPTWAARSLGYMPLAVFLNQRLPAAAGPALAHLALTPLRFSFSTPSAARRGWARPAPSGVWGRWWCETERRLPASCSPFLRFCL